MHPLPEMYCCLSYKALSNKDSRLSVDFSLCDACGKCIGECPEAALKIYGYEADSQEIIDQVARDKEYIDNSGGGLTISGGDHRERIQEAIDSNSKIMLAAGTYTLDGPLVLRDSTILFGSPGMRVIFVQASSWTPTDHVWMIDTDDAADATTYLFEVVTDPPKNDYWGSIRWRTGKNSIVRNVAFGRTSGGHERDIKRVYITGN